MTMLVLIGYIALSLVAVVLCIFCWDLYDKSKKAGQDADVKHKRKEGDPRLKRRRALRNLWLSFILAVAILVGGVYGFFAFWLPWDGALSLEARVKFVSETFKKKTGHTPEDIDLRPSDAAKSGESNLYVGTANVNGKIWNVRVWNAYKELRMEAREK